MTRRDKPNVNTAHDKGPDKKHNLCPRQMEKPKEKLLLQVCNECRQLERGKIDPNDENFYCAACWFAYYGERITPVKEAKQKKKKKISQTSLKEIPEQKIIQSNVYGYGSYYRANVRHTVKQSLYRDERYDKIVDVILAFVHQKFVSYTIQSSSRLGIHWNKSSTDHSFLIVHGFQKQESAARAAGVEVGLELVSINEKLIKNIHFEAGPRRNLEDYYRKLLEKGPVTFMFRRIIPFPLDDEEYYWKEISTRLPWTILTRGIWLLRKKNGEVLMEFNDEKHEQRTIKHFVQWQKTK